MGEEIRYIGPPGCGKTTELTRRALKSADYYGGENVMICSLTRAAGAQVAQELMRQGVPIPEKSVGTLHSFAYHALEGPPIADEPKSLAEWNDFVSQEGFSFLKITTVDPDVDEAAVENSWGGDSLGDQYYAHYQVTRARLQPVEALPELGGLFARLWEQFKTDTGRLDFTDLLFYALRDVDTAPGAPSVIFMDEAQDTSMLGMRLLRKWGEHAEYLAIFGDPLQNLYAWAGTDAEAFTTPDVPDGQKRVLAQSYRVPRAVHAAAVRWIEPLQRQLEAQLGRPVEYYPRDEDGEVRRLGGAHFKYPEAALRDARKYLDAGKTVMFLTACSHMLEPLLAVLRREGLPFHNPWRKKRGDWNPLAPRKGVSAKDRVMAYLRLNADAWGDDAGYWTRQDLWRWVKPLDAQGVLVYGAKTKIEADGKEPLAGATTLTPEQLSSLFELKAILPALVGAETADLGWFESHLLATARKGLKFPIQVVRRSGPAALRRRPQIIVGTIHSLKGSQADVVYLFPDLSQAGMDEWMQRGPGHDGIRRAFYVAMTRAREVLVLCGQASPLAVNLH